MTKDRTEQIRTSQKQQQGMGTTEKTIKCIQVAWSEGSTRTTIPYFTAAYHSQLLSSNCNNEKRFVSEQLVTVMPSTWVAFGRFIEEKQFRAPNPKLQKSEHQATNRSGP